MHKTISDRYLMTIPELAEQIGMSRPFAVRLARAHMKAMFIGRSWYVRRTAYYEYLGSDAYRNRTWAPRAPRKKEGVKTHVRKTAV